MKVLLAFEERGLAEGVIDDIKAQISDVETLITTNFWQALDILTTQDINWLIATTMLPTIDKRNKGAEHVNSRSGGLTLLERAARQRPQVGRILWQTDPDDAFHTKDKIQALEQDGVTKLPYEEMFESYNPIDRIIETLTRPLAEATEAVVPKP